MLKSSTPASRFVTVVAALAFGVQPMAPAVAALAGQVSTSKPPAQTTTKAPRRDGQAGRNRDAGSQAPPPDGGWPRLHELGSGGDFLVYQPQIASWDNQKTMVAYSAVSYRAKPSDTPKLGTMKLEANTKVSVTERLVSFAEHEDHRSQLPGSRQEPHARDRHAASTRPSPPTSA